MLKEYYLNDLNASRETHTLYMPKNTLAPAPPSGSTITVPTSIQNGINKQQKKLYKQTDEYKQKKT